MSRELKGNLAGKSKVQRQAIFKAAAKKCSGSTSKQSSKQKQKRVLRSKGTGGRGFLGEPNVSRIVIQRKKPAKKAIRKTAKQKALSKPVPVSGLEKRTEKYHQRIEQVRLALGVPKSDVTLRITSKNVSIKMGFLKRIKRRKLSDAVRVLEEKARSRV